MTWHQNKVYYRKKICYPLDISYDLIVHYNGMDYNAKLCSISMKIDYNKIEIKPDTP
jgi:hypothetical protein